MKILFTGGGTGGHVFPIIAVAREIRRQTLPGEAKFFYIGPKDEFGAILLSQEGIAVKHIWAGKIRRYLGIASIIQNLVDIFIKLPIGTIQAFSHIFYLAPDIIFSKGGFGSLPAVIAGWFFRTPVFLHESDISPGLANRIVNKFASAVFVSFPQTEYFSVNKMIIVGNPVRKELLEGSKEEAKRIFKISGEKPVILILGGSQGAQRINDMLLLILPEILKDFEIIHQTGEKNFKKVETEAKIMLGVFPSRILQEEEEKQEEEREEKETEGKETEGAEKVEKHYHIVPFLREMELKHAYQICDLIVGRAGSGSIFEIAALGKPSILIPLPEAAQNHQIKNAYYYASAGACMVIEEENLSPYFFLEKVKHLFNQPEELKKMTEKAKEFGRPHSAKVVAGYIVDYLILAG